MLMHASDIAAALDAQLIGPDVVVEGASFDSRTIRAGQLFVPIVAERDGHDFVDAAVRAGAPAYLTSRGERVGDATAIVVADTAAALMALGTFARRRLPDRVVGVTGSVGKTTVKDLAHAALSAHLRTTSNPRSFNNELGLPLTLLNAPDDTEATVLEMGMRGFGEIARLCAVAQPSVGVVTVIGHAHTERVGGLDGVARAKGELVEALPRSGTAVLNAQQDLCMALASRTVARVLTFGTDAGDVRASDVVLDDLARPRFVLVTPWGSAAVSLPISGPHNALNAAAAAAAALALGVPLPAVAAGLERVQVSPWRMETQRAVGGALILNDAYNANPTSTRAALDALASVTLGVGGRRIAALGMLAELGADGPSQHRELVAHATAMGIEVVAVDTAAYGLVPVDGIEGAVEAIGPIGPHDAVLVKGSRVAALERLAERLLAR